MARAPAPGLRLQILVALAGLMVLAFVPLFYAVASLTRATVLDERASQARALARSIAAHASKALATGGHAALEDALRAHAASDGIAAVCVFEGGGTRPVCAGKPSDAEAVGAIAPAATREAAVVHGAGGNQVQVALFHDDIAVAMRMRFDDQGDHGAALVRLVALYMITFALALLFFAYFALTRVIVRPVEHLVVAADRVAGGARTLRVPRSGARELVELGASVQSMTEKLVAEEATLILKIEELTQTQAQLVRSERMASVGRLAAGVAHEIGNPIAALMGMQELLLDGDLPIETQRDFLRRMRRETERIHTVVRDLLDFARPEEATSAAGGPPVPADVREAVADVTALVRTQKAFREIVLDVSIEGSPKVAMAGARLTQVVLNLLLNACAAVDSAKRAGGRVVLRVRPDDARRRVRIEVEDNGPGIAPHVRDRLFEPFVTTKEVGDGTGLGLAVCRGLVESAGGEIGLDPTYSDGARFYVVLPAAAS